MFVNRNIHIYIYIYIYYIYVLICTFNAFIYIKDIKCTDLYVFHQMIVKKSSPETIEEFWPRMFS